MWYSLLVGSLLPSFLVIPRNKVAHHLMSPARAAAIAAIVSIDAPGQRHPPGFQNVERRVRLEFDDVTDPADPMAPTIEDIRRLVAFAPVIRGVPTVLVHCEAGISRSTAAVVILAAALLGPGREREAVDVARRSVPGARPNRLMVSLADAVLARHGALERALEVEVG